MKTNSIKKVFVIALALVALVTFALAVSGLSKRAFANISIVESAVKDTYTLNEIITNEDIKIEVHGQEFSATESMLIYPDGRAYSLDKYTLNKAGEYTLTGKFHNYFATKKFKVFSGNISVSSGLSKIEYVEDYALPKLKTWSLTDENVPAEAVKGSKNYGMVYIPDNPTRVTGVKASIANGDTLNFNVPVQLEKGLTNIIKLFPLQESLYGTGEYKRAVDRLIVTATDAYNPEIKIDFIVSFKDNAYGNIYIRSAGSGQRNGGLVLPSNITISNTYKTKRKEVFIDGIRGVMFFDEYGLYTENRFTQTGIDLLFNQKTNEVLAHTDKTRNMLVNQLTNPDIYGDNLFKGFTTGEVYLSIKGDGYLGSDNLNFIFSDVIGFDNAELTVQGESSLYKDVTSPKFVFSVPEQVEVAKGTTLSVFDYNCYDVNLAQVNVQLFYNYGNAYQTQVAIKEGKFTARLAGAYTLVYTAKDSYGNQTKSLITVNSKNTVSGKTIDYSVTNLEEIVLGKQFALPQPTGVNSPNGQVSVSKKLEYLDNEIYTQVGVEENGNYLLTDYGKYKVTYSFTDGVFSEEYSYELTATAKDDVTFIGNPALPSYFMKGYDYSIDEFSAYKFTENGKEKVNTVVEMRKDGGAYQQIDISSVKIDANNTVQFKFTAGEVSVVSEIIGVTDCGTTSKLKREGYFVGKDFDIAYTSTTRSIDLKTTKDGAVAEFVNPLSIKKLKLEFGVLAEHANFSKLTFIITDYYDDNNSVEVSYLKKEFGEDVRYFLVSPEGETEMGNFYTGTRVFDFVGDNKVRDNKLYLVSVNQAISKFNGVKIRLSVKLEGVTGNAGVFFTAINGQSLYALRVERPMLDSYNYAGSYKIGEKVTIGIPEATDVLASILNNTLTLTVTDPNGNYVTSTDGVKLENAPANREYQIEYTIYGSYSIIFSAKNSVGKDNKLTYKVSVIDAVNPTITLNDGITSQTIKEVSVGSNVVVAGYTLSDDVTSADLINVKVIVMYPRNDFKILNGNTFVAKYKGLYKVSYICEDNSGNVTVVYYNVLAK